MSSCNLFVATTNAAYLWTATEHKVLFSCCTGSGIINSKPAKDGSGLVAIADSHLLVLHNPSGDRRRVRTLKNDYGEPRLLLFSPVRSSLFFTTTLSSAVQEYSLATAELCQPFQAHPSPPNVLEISSEGDFLLSASPKPPTVYLQELRGGRALTQLQPHRSPISCAAFHPYTLRGYFALGTRSGALSLYRFMSKASFNDNVALATPRELHAIKKVHKGVMGGISAINFIPGYTARIITVGCDGRCRLVSFEGHAMVLRTWNAQGPVNCLAVRTISTRTDGRKDQAVLMAGDSTRCNKIKSYEGLETTIAVGTQTGKVSFYNVLGLLAREFDVGLPIISLEWMEDRSILETLTSCREPRSTTRPPKVSMPLNKMASEEEGTVRINPTSHQNSAFVPAPDIISKPCSGTQRPFQYTRCSTERRSYPRPRIVTATFQPPAVPMSKSTGANNFEFNLDSEMSDPDDEISSETWATSPKRLVGPVSSGSPLTSSTSLLQSSPPAGDGEILSNQPRASSVMPDVNIKESSYAERKHSTAGKYIELRDEVRALKEEVQVLKRTVYSSWHPS